MLTAVLNYHWDWPHQAAAMHWLRQGLSRHGVKLIQGRFDEPQKADFMVTWGWRQPRLVEAARAWGIPVLVMERGHLQFWVGCGWNGLANRATYARPLDENRWNRHFGQALADWKVIDEGCSLVCGQVPGDAALFGVDIQRWAQWAIDRIAESGETPVYRPHPGLVERNWLPERAQISHEPLAHDLARARRLVTFNSTVCVEAILAGVPTVALDRGSMAWELTSHALDAPLVRADRLAWCHRLSWAQWAPAEIESGEFWASLREVMPTCGPAPVKLELPWQADDIAIV